MTAAASNSKFSVDTDFQITFQDQQMINKFAKLNAKLEETKYDLESKQNELKNTKEAVDEIELFDEDELIPYVEGDVFVSYKLPKVQELLAEAQKKLLSEIKDLEQKAKELQGQTLELKTQLYDRFGDNIYLENEEEGSKN